mgnify:CR=1 FL=1
MLNIGAIIKSVDENTGDFDFVTWSGGIDEVIKNNDLFLPWNSAWWNRSWSLLDCPFLIVSIHTHAGFKEETFGISLANNASS